MGQGTKRNQPCWCGSGKKFKKCHYRRDEQEPVTVGESLEGYKRAHRPRECLHPDASEETCSGKPISSHSIQRRGSLSRIATKGHVLGFKADLGHLNKTGGRIEPRQLGLKKASTFPGFCAAHDRDAFAPIETEKITPTPEQGFLLAYRALCKELHQKRALAEVASKVLEPADRGRSKLEQYAFQRWRKSFEFGASLGTRDLEREKRLHDQILRDRNWEDQHRFLAIELTERPTIVSAGAVIPECDFAGNALAKLGREDVDCDLLAFAIVADESTGLVIWACRADSPDGMAFLRQAATMSDAELVQGAARFAFEFLENTFVSPDWWKTASPEVQEAVVRRANSGILDDPGSERLQDDGVQLVNWTAGSRISRLGSR